MKKALTLILLAVFITGSVLLTGCTAKKTAPTAGSNTKPVVAVSIVPQETFVKAVSGDRVNTVVMIPPGYNPENYAPSPQEMTGLSKANLYFAIGVPAETANILPEIKDFNPNVKIVDLAAAAAAVYPEREFAPGSRDPHIWLSPLRVKVMVQTIAEELASLDPDNADFYQSNAENYLAELDELNENIKASLGGLENKSFVVYHPAFGYFADDYGLQMVAIEEEGKEATAAGIQEVVDLAREEHIQVVFYQAENSSRQADTIARELGGYTEMVAPLDADYIHNLQKMADTFARVLK